MTKVTYIISDISKMIAVEWICTYIDPTKIKLSFIFLNSDNSEIEDYVRERNYKYLRIPYAGKKDIPKALWGTRKFLKKVKPDAVHCHLFDACIVGLTAAKIVGIKKRIYTRHHSTYHHVYFPKGVKYDRYLNKIATDIVAISEVVKKVLIVQEHVPPQKIHLIHHGFLFEEFNTANESHIQEFKSKYGIIPGDIVIGVVARYNLYKGIQYIIPAFIQLLKEYPKAKLLLANNQGNDEAYIRNLLEGIPQDRIIEVNYERNMAALYKSLSIYVHVPVYDHVEAFGQTYIEALMAGTPSVFTLSGVAREFIQDGRNALTVGFETSEPIYMAIKRLISDNELYERISRQGILDVKENFGIKGMIDKLEELYLS